MSRLKKMKTEAALIAKATVRRNAIVNLQFPFLTYQAFEDLNAFWCLFDRYIFEQPSCNGHVGHLNVYVGAMLAVGRKGAASG